MTDWRQGKSVVDCHRYMLEQGIFCDVTFEVGPDGRATEMIRAHKYMLAARSEVFLAMFNSELKETGEVVRIVDIGPVDFRQMLRYIYADDAKLTADNIQGQMYAAEKYNLSGLIQSCEKWMELNIDIDNACAIMQCADLYHREDLLIEARKYILQNASKVLPGQGFVKVSQTIVEELLANDELGVSEDVIYEACVRWAQHQCNERGEEATGPAIRQALGDCLQLIRFPTMVPSRFVELEEKYPDVLDKDEVISVLKSNIVKSESTFSRKERNLQLCSLHRFDSINQAIMWLCDDGKPDAISFTCDSSIRLKGITVFGNEQCSQNDIEIEVLTDDGAVIFKEPRKPIRLVSDKEPMRGFFEKHVLIPADKQYTITQKMWGERIYFGVEGKDAIVCENVTFRFYKSTHSKNGTDVFNGQIPGLLFTRC